MKIKTLIVDDEPIARDRVRRMLRAEKDLEIIGECGNGAETVEFINEHQPDLVFLDIQMPEMNGYETTIVLKKKPEFINIPIIALTAGTTDGEKEKCLEIGMNDYISKPIDKVQLKNVLNKWINLV